MLALAKPKPAKSSCKTAKGSLKPRLLKSKDELKSPSKNFKIPALPNTKSTKIKI